MEDLEGSLHEEWLRVISDEDPASALLLRACSALRERGSDRGADGFSPDALARWAVWARSAPRYNSGAQGLVDTVRSTVVLVVAFGSFIHPEEALRAEARQARPQFQAAVLVGCRWVATFLQRANGPSVPGIRDTLALACVCAGLVRSQHKLSLGLTHLALLRQLSDFEELQADAYKLSGYRPVEHSLHHARELVARVVLGRESKETGSEHSPEVLPGAAVADPSEVAQILARLNPPWFIDDEVKQRRALSAGGLLLAVLGALGATQAKVSLLGVELQTDQLSVLTAILSSALVVLFFAYYTSYKAAEAGWISITEERAFQLGVTLVDSKLCAVNPRSLEVANGSAELVKRARARHIRLNLLFPAMATIVGLIAALVGGGVGP